MKKIKINFYDEYVYYEKIDNGLEIYVVPNNSVKDVYVTFTTKYGGVNNPFKLNDKLIKVPNGIAHFLEHKMFEQESGEDPFEFYNKSGTYCNAFTNYFNTSYMFAGNNNFKKNMNYLLDFVQAPYFTDENVEKEKGIISQEIKMYEDMPDNIIFEKSMYNLFKNDPIKYTISGTVSDISKINKEDLYNTYNAFYNPSNMFIVITGNIEPSEAINIIKDNQKDKKFDKVNVEILKDIEPLEVSKKKDLIKHNVSMPYISYSVKIPINNLNIERKKLNLYLSFIFSILFDETSIFYEKMKDLKLLNTSIDIDNIDTDNYKVFMLTFKSNKYKEVIKEIDNILNNFKISEFDLERKKKVDISNMLYIFDDISRTNRFILNNKILYDNIYPDIYDIIKGLNIDELNDIIKNIDLNNKSILVIENRE